MGRHINRVLAGEQEVPCENLRALERNNDGLHHGGSCKADEKDPSSGGASKENMEVFNDNEIHVGGTGAKPWPTGTFQASVRGLALFPCQCHM